MRRIKQYSQIILIGILLSSCTTPSDKEFPINNSEENIIKGNNQEKKKKT